MDKRVVKPAPGKVAFDRYGRRVPEEGARVVWDAYWQRRQDEGGITSEPVDSSPAPSEPAKPKRARKKTKTESEDET